MWWASIFCSSFSEMAEADGLTFSPAVQMHCGRLGLETFFVADAMRKANDDKSRHSKPGQRHTLRRYP